MILTILSRKGGVGKTTTAVNLAAGLADEAPTLLVDLDSQANVGTSLGIEFPDLVPSITDALLDGESMEGVIRDTSVQGLSLITCDHRFKNAAARIGKLEATERGGLLREALQEVQDRFSYIVIDTGELDLVAANALAASDAYIMTIQPEKLSLDGLKIARNEIQELGAIYGFETQMLGILFTMVDHRITTVQDVVSQVRNALGDAVFQVEIPRNTRVAEAPWVGKPVSLASPMSTGAEAYRAFTLEVLQRMRKSHL